MRCANTTPPNLALQLRSSEGLNPRVTMIRDLMIGGGSIEDTLTLWASSLRDAKRRIGPAQSLPKKAWRRVSAGEGTKGPRWHDWAYLELADLKADEYNDTLAGTWTRGLLVRRNIA